MATFKITGPDGQTYRVTAPDDATDEQVMAYVQQNAGKESAMGGGPDAMPDDSMRRAGAAAAKSQPIKAGILNAAQGPLMNFADEIGATGAAAIDRFVTQRNPGFSFGQLRDRYLDVARGSNKQYEADNPIQAPLLQAGAGLATGIGAARMLPGAALPTLASAIAPTGAAGRIGVAALGGAGYGAVGGAGSAETMADVPGQAAAGAALGAVTGGALNALGQGGGAVVQNMAARGANSRIVQDRLERGTSGGGVGTRVAQKVDDWANDLARQRVANALEQDNPVKGALRNTTGQAQARLRTLGDDARLAFASRGDNTRDLLDTMVTMPGETKARVGREARVQMAGRGRELTGAAEQGLGTGGMRLAQTLEGLDAMRANASRPLYDQVRGLAVEVDDDLAALLQRAKPAFTDAERLAKLKGVPFELPEAIRAVEAARKPVNTSNMLTEKAAPPTVRIGQIDTLKRTLYDMEQANINPETGRLNEIGNALKDLRRAVVKKADDATRDADGRSLYEAARNVYAGPSELRAAANLGSQSMSKDGWKITGMMDGMSESEMQAFRIGAMESLRSKLGTQGGQTTIMKMWREPATQEKLRAIFPDVRSFREFAAKVNATSRTALDGIGAGSKTAARQAGQDDEGAAALTAAADAAGAVGRLSFPAMIAASRNLYGRTVMPEPVRDRIGQMLLMQGPEAQGLLGDLPGYVAQANARRAAAAGRTGLLSGIGVNSLLGD